MRGYNGVLSCSYRYFSLNRQNHESTQKPLKKNTYSTLNRCSHQVLDWEYLTFEIKYVSFCLSCNILYTFFENMQLYCLFSFFKFHINKEKINTIRRLQIASLFIWNFEVNITYIMRNKIFIILNINQFLFILVLINHYLFFSN